MKLQKMRNVLISLTFSFLWIFGKAQDSIAPLKVGYASAAPFIIKEDDLLEGINIWLWQRVAEELELEYTLVEMPFDEILKGLENGTVDVCINPLTITSERSKQMEFTNSFYASHSTVVVAKQSTFQKVKSFVASFFNLNFLRGFLLLLFIFMLFGVPVWLFERKRNFEQFRPGLKGLWDGLWWAVVTLTTVGYGDKAPKTKAGKFMALGLMFSGMLFVSGLTASIASSLTVNQLSSGVSDFNDFKNRRVGTIPNSSAEEFLKTHFFKDVTTYAPLKKGLMQLSKNNLDAFIYDAPIMQYRIKKDSSLQNLQMLPLKFDVQFYAFGVKKGAIELEKAITQKILEINETQRWDVVLSEYGLSEL